MNKNFIIALLCCLSLSHGALASTLLIKNVTLISGVPNSEPIQGVDVFVEDGVIREIDRALNLRASIIVDGVGKTLLPGLIDSHTHLLSVPGSYFRKDSYDVVDPQQILQLKAYLDAGVTTVLDAAAPPEVFTKWKDEPRKPRIYGLSPFLTPSDGYFGSPALRTKTYENLPPAVGSGSGEIAKILATPKANSSVGIKVTMEDGFGPIPVWPLFDEVKLKEIREEARLRNLNIFVHAQSSKEFELGLTLNPYAFVHGGFSDETPSDEFLHKLKQSGAYVVSTLAIYDLPLLIWQKNRFEEAMLKRLVPPLQIETGLDQEIANKLIKRMATTNAPKWIPNFLIHSMASWFFTERIATKLLLSSMRAIKKMHDFGIPVIMGSDAGNWPLWTTFFHGYATIRELELLEQAGIPRAEIIISSTSRSAKMIGQLDATGSIEVGKTADLVLLNSNPLDVGMSAFREPSLVILNGKIVSGEIKDN